MRCPVGYRASAVVPSRVLSFALLSLAPNLAFAQPKHAGGSALIAARGLVNAEDSDAAPEVVGSAGLDLRGAATLGSFPVGLAAGMGYHFGASVPGGFAYEAALMPLGISGIVDGIGWIAVLGGGDLSGVTTRVDFAPRLIAEARLEFELPGPFHFATYIRPAWLAVDARQDGAKDLQFADEFDAGVGLRIGAEHHKMGFVTSRGLFVGGVLRQWLDVSGYGLIVGYTVDGMSH